MDNLTNISPIDGRYHNQTKILSDYFSEYALIKTRIEVEVEYLIALSKLSLKNLNTFSDNDIKVLRSIYKDFNLDKAKIIKELEMSVNHDVKAVEYYIKKVSKELNLNFNYEYIHFGLTSQDINNTSFPLMTKRFIEEIYLPKIKKILNTLLIKIEEYKDITILAKTHGQPASPTTMGKELKVFEYRIKTQLEYLDKIEISAKFGGATGGLNAHKVTFPDLDWTNFANEFIKEIGLKRQKYTTQIENYDNLSNLFDTSKRINNILVDLSRDIWSYISFDIFKQKINPNEVGSSAMPHKVNPIDFENAEGNLMFASSMFDFLTTKLPISRLQRDLTDSTVLRNIGVPYSHTIIGLNSILKGINKLEINKKKITDELENNWLVIAEAIQNILRREGYQGAYEALKAFTRNNNKPKMTQIHNFIDSLEVEDIIKKELKFITPTNYIGYSNIID